MADIKHISASKIGTYNACPFLYYLKYIRHEKVQTSVQLVFGREIHYMLEQYYKRNFKSDDSFVNSWKYRWRQVVGGEFLKGKEKEHLQTTTHDYTLSNGEVTQVILGNHIRWFEKRPVLNFFSYKRMGERILRDFYNKHQYDPKPISVEERFTIDWRGHILKGVIDRVDKDMYDRNIIIDYKTDKHPPKGRAHILNNSPQFTIYSLAFKSLYDEELDTILYYHLRSGKLYKTSRTEADYEYLDILCKDIKEAVEKERFTPNYGYQCNFCDYRGPCSKYSYGSEGAMEVSDTPLPADVDEWLWEVKA
tara:strand:- start:1100 stop:2020 length:921 start_codon:yes stop_codon:yes gene_type:complete